VHADVDAREGDRHGEDAKAHGHEPRKRAAEEQRERDGAGGARRRVARRHRRPDRPVEERIGLGHDGEGARPVEPELEERRREVARPDAPGHERGRQQHLPSGPVREPGREGDPDEPAVADHGQEDEDRVERPDAVLDDPDERAAVRGSA